MKPRVVLCFSGGMDSTYMAYALANADFHVIPLFVEMSCMKQGKHACLYSNSTQAEMLESYEYLQTKVQLGSPIIINEVFPDDFDNTFPGRNLFLLTTALQHALRRDAPFVAMGLYGDVENPDYPDSSFWFIQHMRELVSRCGMYTRLMFMEHVHVESKAEVLARLLDKGLFGAFIHHTHWCYERSESMNIWGRGCGTCTSCKNMQEAYGAAVARNI